MKIAHLAQIDKDNFTGPRNSVTMLSCYLNELSGVQADVFTSENVTPFKFNNVYVHPLTDENDLLKYDCISNVVAF